MVIVFIYRYLKPKNGSKDNAQNPKASKQMKKSAKAEDPPKVKEEYKI